MDRRENKGQNRIWWMREGRFPEEKKRKEGERNRTGRERGGTTGRKMEDRGGWELLGERKPKLQHYTGADERFV